MANLQLLLPLIILFNTSIFTGLLIIPSHNVLLPLYVSLDFEKSGKIYYVFKSMTNTLFDLFRKTMDSLLAKWDLL